MYLQFTIKSCLEDMAPMVLVDRFVQMFVGEQPWIPNTYFGLQPNNAYNQIL